MPSAKLGRAQLPSFSGVGHSKNDIEHPRILITEPLGQGEYTRINKRARKEFLAAGQKTIALDIYGQAREDSLAPQIFKLLILENVINDPGYSKQKNIPNMFNLLKKTIAPQGLVLFIDSFVSFQTFYTHIYSGIITYAPYFGFDVILDELSTITPEHQTMEEKKRLLLDLVEKIKIADPALIKGVERNCNHGFPNYNNYPTG